MKKRKQKTALLAAEKKEMKDKKETIITDPFGSYTGLCVIKGEEPVQDSDDL